LETSFMQILVVLAHPRPGSFNHAIAATAMQALHENGHQVIFHDLHAERFDPVITPEEIPAGAALDPLIQQHCAELAAADGIVIVHPNWWGQTPAMLKGWIDRVLRPEVAYGFAEGDSGAGVPLGLLRAQAALVLNTSDTPKERELAVFGDPLETIWKNCIFGFCGVHQVHRRMFEVVATATPQQREAWLAEVRELVQRCFPVAKYG
jgi:putative NADPH-quinone reductase